MSTAWHHLGRWPALVGGCGLMAGLLLGCRTADPSWAAFPEATTVGTPPAPAVGIHATNRSDLVAAVERFRVGDTVTVTFSGVEAPPPPHEERIKEDGTITLPMIGSILAAGKSPGELQREIQERYSRYYTRLTVTVKSLERFYYVGGEVRSPGRYPWLGELTVTQAIQSAGDFTDFARKTRVLLVRSDGSTVTVDCRRAIERPELDPKVMPGDRIHVPRRFW